MTYSEFLVLCESEAGLEGLSGPLTSLCIEKNGDWDAAHTLVQGIPSREGSWVHAYLHRKEGDLANAGYWYRRAERSMPGVGLDEEWEAIVRELLNP